jgi:hypothetical protein
MCDLLYVCVAAVYLIHGALPWRINQLQSDVAFLTLDGILRIAGNRLIFRFEVGILSSEEWIPLRPSKAEAIYRSRLQCG